MRLKEINISSGRIAHILMADGLSINHTFPSSIVIWVVCSQRLFCCILCNIVNYCIAFKIIHGFFICLSDQFRVSQNRNVHDYKLCFVCVFFLFVCFVCVCVRACVRACVRVCVRALRVMIFRWPLRQVIDVLRVLVC